LKNLGPEEGVFVRIGSTNRKADAALLQELRRMAPNETFDESPLAEFDSEALDFRAASESFPARGRLTKADLQTLRLLTSPGRRSGSYCLTHVKVSILPVPVGPTKRNEARGRSGDETPSAPRAKAAASRGST
jgi:hypothetical protein